MTEEDVARIRTGHWPSDREAAEALGVGLKSVNFARRGITWRHIAHPPAHAARSCGPDPYGHRTIGRKGGG